MFSFFGFGKGKTIISMFEATKNGNIDFVIKTLQENIDINVYLDYSQSVKLIDIDNNYTILMVAIKNGHNNIVEYLIRHGANVNRAVHFMKSALVIAVEYNNKDAMELLLSNGANVNDRKDNYDSTALDIAIQQNNVEAVEILLVHGANTNPKQYQTPLELAATRGYTKIVKQLLESGADINHKDNHVTYTSHGETISGLTALDHAVFKGHIDTAMFIMENYSDRLDYQCWTPIFAAEKGYYEIIVEFINQGIDINYPDGDNRTLLFYAISNGHDVIAEYLIEHGADVNIIDDYNIGILKIAVNTDNTKIVRLLLKKNATFVNHNHIGSKDWLGQLSALPISDKNRAEIGATYLMGNKNIGNKLAKIGNIYNESKKQKSSYCEELFNAARNNNKDIVEMLISHGANINAMDKNGLTVFENINKEDVYINKGKAVKIDQNIITMVTPKNIVYESNKDKLQELINNAVAIGDTIRAQALLRLLDK